MLSKPISQPLGKRNSKTAGQKQGVRNPRGAPNNTELGGKRSEEGRGGAREGGGVWSVG